MAAHTCKQQAGSGIWKSESPLRTLIHAGTTVPDYVIETKLMIQLQEEDRLLCKSRVRRVNYRSLVAG